MRNKIFESLNRETKIENKSSTNMYMEVNLKEKDEKYFQKKI